MTHTNNRWCFAWANHRLPRAGRDRAALANAYKWVPGQAISMSFLDGSTALQARVKEASQQWIGPDAANLAFAYATKPLQRTDVRISFKHPGSWSALGTSCKQNKDPNLPTMNFGWLTDKSTDEEVQAVVLHEIGHMLGLIHEHQNPLGNKIQWNIDAIVADLSGPPNHWDLATIKTNVIDPYEQSEINGTLFDPHSIMMYAIPAAWTSGTLTTPANVRLSKRDKAFIRGEYP